MSLIQWHKDFETGIEGVDREHQDLIGELNAIYARIETSDDKFTIINALSDIHTAIAKHFRIEERWMQEHEYDHFRIHREDHQRILDEIRSVNQTVKRAEAVDLAQLKQHINSWFAEHFQTHDGRLHRIENLPAHPVYEPPPSAGQRTPVAIWLLACCAVIFVMIILGGVTRLTGSGLSMVQWEPIMGVLPPLNQTQWQETFTLYQQYPEYKIKNYGMSLAEFKSIFWFEYAHRVLGRTIGIIFLLPFIYFYLRGQIHKSLQPKLIKLFVLGGLQGLLGWYMVKSGLVDDPHVSQYRLTAHLGLAIIIYGYMFWVALDLLYPNRGVLHDRDERVISRQSRRITGLIFLTALSGGLVAGTRAGFAFNTFPLMNGQLIPDGLFEMSPWWRNLFENIVTVQFDHRLLATLLFIFIPLFWYRVRPLLSETRARLGLDLLLAALALQLILGISTLLLVVPVPLAAAHQGGAVLLLTVSLFVSHQLRDQSAYA